VRPAGALGEGLARSRALRGTALVRTVVVGTALVGWILVGTAVVQLRALAWPEPMRTPRAWMPRGRPAWPRILCTPGPLVLVASTPEPFRSGGTPVEGRTLLRPAGGPRQALAEDRALQVRTPSVETCSAVRGSMVGGGRQVGRGLGQVREVGLGVKWRRVVGWRSVGEEAEVGWWWAWRSLGVQGWRREEVQGHTQLLAHLL